jgi:hypothetical protein
MLDLIFPVPLQVGHVLLHIDVHGGAHALTCDLHQSELAQRQNVVACTVFLHVLAHALIEQLPVLGQVHVDEVDHDDSSHITQSELSGQLIGSTEVGIECRAFLPILFFDLLPLLTSTTCMASVCSMMR